MSDSLQGKKDDCHNETLHKRNKTKSGTRQQFAKQTWKAVANINMSKNGAQYQWTSETKEKEIYVTEAETLTFSCNRRCWIVSMDHVLVCSKPFLNILLTCRKQHNIIFMVLHFAQDEIYGTNE
jgi:hypothetical protein